MQPLIGSLEGAQPRIHPEAWVAPDAVLVGNVVLGRAASVWYGAVLRADEDEIIVGAECNIQDQCCLHVDPGEPAVLEDRVSLGHRAVVHGAYVETGSLIGIGAIVLGRARVGAGSLIFREEVFGPVLAVTSFATADEAVALANATDYGLIAGVWTSSISTAITIVASTFHQCGRISCTQRSNAAYGLRCSNNSTGSSTR